jgi:predicted Fe-S protein YdhL (DUF1289 family)
MSAQSVDFPEIYVSRTDLKSVCLGCFILSEDEAMLSSLILFARP